MKKRILFLILVVSLIFISGCTSTVPTEQPSLPIAEIEEPTTQIQEDQAIVSEMNENKDERTIINEDTPPVLKNLVVNMGPWDRQTNRAGDIVFSKKLLFNDGYINNEKVFLGFGEFEHSVNNPDRSVEYWWFLSPGTKVRAPADGVVSVGCFEHTKDWGV